jgi:hypothetical protein
LKLNPNQVKENYISSVKNFTNALKLRCGQYHIDFVEADINKGFDTILYTYLVKRQMMMK